MSADLVALTETKKKGQRAEKLGHYDYIYSELQKENRAQLGVSILIR